MIYKELTIRGVLSMPVDDTFRAIELIESWRHPFEKMHTQSLPLEQAELAIHALAGDIPGVNPIHLAIVPGAPPVSWGAGGVLTRWPLAEPPATRIPSKLLRTADRTWEGRDEVRTALGQPA